MEWHEESFYGNDESGTSFCENCHAKVNSNSIITYRGMDYCSRCYNDLVD